MVIGLWLDSLNYVTATVAFSVRRPSLIPQIPLALRRTAIAIGFLFFVLVLVKDRSLSPLFFFSFIPIFYLLILATGHFLPRLFIRGLDPGLLHYFAHFLAGGVPPR